MTKEIKNGYTDLGVCIGHTLEQVVNILQYENAKGTKCYVDFNGHILYSDTVTMDSAYLEVTGMTKAEYEAYLKAQHEEYERKEAEHKAKIPELTAEYIEKGHEIIQEKYWDLWDKCVPIRLGDLYHGMELGCCLDLIEILQNEKDIEKAKKVFEEQGHSGMSAWLLASMLSSFCDCADELVSYIRGML